MTRYRLSQVIESIAEIKQVNRLLDRDPAIARLWQLDTRTGTASYLAGRVVAARSGAARTTNGRARFDGVCRRNCRWDGIPVNCTIR